MIFAESIQTKESVILYAETQITAGQAKFNEPRIDTTFGFPI